MKRQFLLTFLIAVCATALIACGGKTQTAHMATTATPVAVKPSPTPGPSPTATPPADLPTEFQPEVDPNKIHTLAEKQAAISAAYKRQQARTMAAYQAKQAATTKLFKEYQEFEKKELMKVRDTDYNAYVLWLEYNYFDSPKKNDLERDNSAIRQFRKAVDAHPYNRGPEAAEKRYDMIVKNAEKVYEMECDIAEKAYEKSQQQKP